ncbi:MAG: hypothetical protein H7333_01210, partial [Bdellovibrionales bacterium]|nr:hypothetical protein [Oligoflexia bacterium]
MKAKFTLLLLATLVLGVVPSVFADEIERDVPALCNGLDKAFQKRDWGRGPCRDLKWKFDTTSVEGRPLIYYSFGPEDSQNVTLILSMVHGDEITPLYLGF